jgi:ABC-type sugar transport system ATPase subunit
MTGPDAPTTGDPGRAEAAELPRPGRPPGALVAERLTKTFGWVHALNGVSIELRAGEVTAVVGDNGAGKSTLMKILAGAVRPDAGTISIKGRECSLRDTHDALGLGIAAVYQDLALVNQRDIASNVFLGQEPTGRFKLVVQRRRMMQESARVFAELGLRMPPMRTLVGNLSGGQRQAVAIARILAVHGAQVVLLDEPTAALGVHQSQVVLNLIRRLANSQIAVMVISHNLQHVLSIADVIHVMFRGSVVGVRAAGSTHEEELVGMIVGKTPTRPAVTDEQGRRAME